MNFYFWVIWSHLIRRVLVMLMPFYHHCLTVVTIYNHICDHHEICTYLTVVSSRPLWTLADKGFWTLSPVQALGVAKCWLSSIWVRMRMMVIMIIDWWWCDDNANNDNYDYGFLVTSLVWHLVSLYSGHDMMVMMMMAMPIHYIAVWCACSLLLRIYSQRIFQSNALVP